MKSILFICESYYRAPSPNGICVQSVAEQAIKEGHRVDIVTVFNDEHQIEYEVVNGVHIHRVDPGFIRRELYKSNPTIHPELQNRQKLILKLSALNGLIKAFRYPFLSEKQVTNLQKKAEELYKLNKYQYVVVVYHQIHPVLAGIRLKQTFPVIDLILYTLDAISGGWVPNILHSHKIPMCSLKRWERYFFENVDRVFAMESHYQYYQTEEYAKYKDKIFYLDIPLLNPIKQEKISYAPKDKIRFVFTGSMHKDTANPGYLLKLLPHLLNVCVDIYGNISPDIMNKIKDSGLIDNQIFYHGRVSHDEVLGIQRNADILLNFGNANSNMIPCKIFEYISSGRPILSFTHSKADSSLPYMYKYPNTMVVEESSEQIVDNSKKIERFINENRCVDINFIQNSFKKNTPSYFLQLLIEGENI